MRSQELGFFLLCLTRGTRFGACQQGVSHCRILLELSQLPYLKLLKPLLLRGLPKMQWNICTVRGPKPTRLLALKALILTLCVVVERLLIKEANAGPTSSGYSRCYCPTSILQLFKGYMGMALRVMASEQELSSMRGTLLHFRWCCKASSIS